MFDSPAPACCFRSGPAKAGGRSAVGRASSGCPTQATLADGWRGKSGMPGLRGTGAWERDWCAGGGGNANRILRKMYEATERRPRPIDGSGNGSNRLGGAQSGKRHVPRDRGQVRRVLHKRGGGSGPMPVARGGRPPQWIEGHCRPWPLPGRRVCPTGPAKATGHR